MSRKMLERWIFEIQVIFYCNTKRKTKINKYICFYDHIFAISFFDIIFIPFKET